MGDIIIGACIRAQAQYAVLLDVVAGFSNISVSIVFDDNCPYMLFSFVFFLLHAILFSSAKFQRELQSDLL